MILYIFLMCVCSWLWKYPLIFGITLTLYNIRHYIIIQERIRIYKWGFVLLSLYTMHIIYIVDVQILDFTDIDR